MSFPVQCDCFNGSTLLTDRDSTVIRSLVYLIDHFSGMSVNSVFHAMQIALSEEGPEVILFQMLKARRIVIFKY